MTAFAAMTLTEDDRQRTCEEWRRTPHPYMYDYPRYLCKLCRLWPGFPVHDVPLRSQDSSLAASRSEDDDHRAAVAPCLRSSESMVEVFRKGSP